MGDELAKLLVDDWLQAKLAGGDSARKVSTIDKLDAQRTLAREAGV